MSENYYDILKVDYNCDFTNLKRAYYRKAKTCHPDLFNNSRIKEEEFKLLVIAFDTLSDPEKRRNYNLSIDIGNKDDNVDSIAAKLSKRSIMDTVADDILEELIVGNDIPRNATLATLMLDLKKTEVFITFREGKNLFYKRNYKAALHLFRKAVINSPRNILYHCYTARTYTFLSRFGKAHSHYQAAIKIGSSRMPPQYMENIRNEMDFVKKKRLPWWYVVKSIFVLGNNSSRDVNPSDKMIENTNQAISRIMNEDAEESKNRKLLE